MPKIKKGFTLIEIMTAIFIGSIISVSSLYITNASIESSSQRAFNDSFNFLYKELNFIRTAFLTVSEAEDIYVNTTDSNSNVVLSVPYLEGGIQGRNGQNEGVLRSKSLLIGRSYTDISNSESSNITIDGEIKGFVLLKDFSIKSEDIEIFVSKNESALSDIKISNKLDGTLIFELKDGVSSFSPSYRSNPANSAKFGYSEKVIKSLLVDNTTALADNTFLDGYKITVSPINVNEVYYSCINYKFGDEAINSQTNSIKTTYESIVFGRKVKSSEVYNTINNLCDYNIIIPIISK